MIASFGKGNYNLFWKIEFVLDFKLSINTMAMFLTHLHWLGFHTFLFHIWFIVNGKIVHSSRCQSKIWISNAKFVGLFSRCKIQKAISVNYLCILVSCKLEMVVKVAQTCNWLAEWGIFLGLQIIVTSVLFSSYYEWQSLHDLGQSSFLFCLVLYFVCFSPASINQYPSFRRQKTLTLHAISISLCLSMFR